MLSNETHPSLMWAVVTLTRASRLQSECECTRWSECYDGVALAARSYLPLVAVGIVHERARVPQQQLQKRHDLERGAVLQDLAGAVGVVGLHEPR